MPLTENIKKGMYILFNNEPCLVTEANSHATGRGNAVINSRLKKLSDNTFIQKTFKSGESAEEIEVNYKNMQYLYIDGETLTFMDPDTFEQYNMPKKIAENFLPFMKEGESYTVSIYNNLLISINFPNHVILKIVDTQDAVKGNTANRATKEATLETGLKIQVPLFIKGGEMVKINPENLEYLGRIKEE